MMYNVHIVNGQCVGSCCRLLDIGLVVLRNLIITGNC